MKRISKFWKISFIELVPNWDLQSFNEDNDHNKFTVLYDDGSIEYHDNLPYNASLIGESTENGENIYFDFSNEQYCPILINSHWGFINNNFELICEPKFDFVGTERDIKVGGCHVPSNVYHYSIWENNHLPVVFNGINTYINRLFRIDPYFERINSKRQLTMDDIVCISKELLPIEYRNKPWSFIDHGVSLLTTEEQMDAYIVAYGEMHTIKCRAAYQNFPFEKIPFKVEIVDWGCGQGIATLVFLEELRERGLEDRVKRIILIEPSSETLSRAETNIRIALGRQSLCIESFNKYLPSQYDSLNSISATDLQFNGPATINLFSNILDIPSIDLKKTASLILSSGRSHYVICMSPLNNNSARVDEFCQLLNKGEYFSHITAPYFAKTSDTHHNFGCMTRGFVIENRSYTTINENVILCNYTEEGIYDDYDRRALVRNGLLSEQFINVYEWILERLSNDDSVFIKPSIEADTPDIIVIKPEYGILIMKIFEENIHNLKMAMNEIRDENDLFKMVSPIQTVLGYKKNFEDLYSSKLVQARIKNKSAYYIVKTAVCFPYLSENDAKAFCDSGYTSLSKSDRGCVAILGKDSFGKQIWNNVGFQYKNNSFTDSISAEIIELISSRWHTYKEGDTDFKLKGDQKELSRSIESNKRKIRGVAGSGKTQVLVSRAVNCQRRTGGKVLILTYNITLANYIKYRLSRVAADFLWDNFVLGTYYRFFTSQAKNTSLKIDISSSYENICFFDHVSDVLPKYDSILIDEAQDYKSEWLQILQKYFLKAKGEFIVFGDVKQNIYARPLEDNKLIRVPNIRGEWKTLKKCFRLENPKLLDLAIAFQHEFMPELQADEAELELVLNLFDSQIKYFDIGEFGSSEQMYNLIKQNQVDLNEEISNIVVLSSTCEIIRTLDFVCRQNGMQTSTMCETKECYDKIKQDCGDNERKFLGNIHSVRENKKHHFSMNKQGLKMSTIHSFKGWEAKTVVLIIPPSCKSYYDSNSTELNDQVVYTAITRATQNLVIINMGNHKYGTFFKTYIGL